MRRRRTPRHFRALSPDERARWLTWLLAGEPDELLARPYAPELRTLRRADPSAHAWLLTRLWRAILGRQCRPLKDWDWQHAMLWELLSDKNRPVRDLLAQYPPVRGVDEWLCRPPWPPARN